VREARTVAGAAEETEEAEETEADEEMGEETDHEIDADEADQARETAPDQSAAGARQEKLTRLQKACVDFCISLLNHRITRKEYDSPLVCALAVLGVKEEGWKGAEQYPPILSAVIKITRFMVVQQGLELADLHDREGTDDDDDDFNNSAYESAPSARRRPKGYLQFV
jgi:hypothetical protein